MQTLAGQIKTYQAKVNEINDKSRQLSEKIWELAPVVASHEQELNNSYSTAEPGPSLRTLIQTGLQMMDRNDSGVMVSPESSMNTTRQISSEPESMASTFSEMSFASGAMRGGKPPRPPLSSGKSLDSPRSHSREPGERQQSFSPQSWASLRSDDPDFSFDQIVPISIQSKENLVKVEPAIIQVQEVTQSTIPTMAYARAISSTLPSENATVLQTPQYAQGSVGNVPESPKERAFAQSVTVQCDHPGRSQSRLVPDNRSRSSSPRTPGFEPSLRNGYASPSRKVYQPPQMRSLAPLVDARKARSNSLGRTSSPLLDKRSADSLILQESWTDASTKSLEVNGTSPWVNMRCAAH